MDDQYFTPQEILDFFQEIKQLSDLLENALTQFHTKDQQRQYLISNGFTLPRLVNFSFKAPMIKIFQESLLKNPITLQRFDADLEKQNITHEDLGNASENISISFKKLQKSLSLINPCSK